MRFSSGSVTNRPAQAADRAGAQPPAAPISDSELTALFPALADAGRIALAVSGGADSLALLDCVHRWRRQRGRPDIIVLTVDHRLQPGSGEAAAAVKAVARSLGLPCRILVREGEAPSASVEASAREARYRLLLDACHDAGASHLVLAHQQDDVAETFLMRLKRGAGVFGLAAMRAALDVGGVTIVRPFLGISRARLAATASAAGLAAIDDPMNSDPRFGRTAARRFLAESGLDREVIATLAMRFAELADAIDAQATAFMRTSVSTDAYAIAWVDKAAFAALPDMLRERVLVRLLLAVGGEGYPPRSHQLAALMEAMVAARRGRFKRTLAGAVVERQGARFAVYREAGRSPPPPVAIRPGETIVFDHRFAVSVSKSLSHGLAVGMLGAAQGLAVGARSGIPPGARASLPAVRRGAEILAIPGFLEGPATFCPLLAARLLAPPLFPTASDRSPSGNPTASAAFPS